jgi:hypothetical protein
MMIPEDGQGARKLKSYMLAGGAMEMKPRISGRRINNCIPIQAPKLTPATQVVSASGWIDCTQSRADAASLNSPIPLSNRPWLSANEGLVEKLDDLIVHRPPGLRMRMEDHRDRGAGAGAGMETSFEAPLGAGKNNFGHYLVVLANKVRLGGCAAASGPI